MRIEECLEKSRFEAQGSIVLNGQPIPYRTVCEDNFFVDEEGQPTATIFSYAYFRSDVADPSCLLYTSPSPRDRQKSRMPSSA